MPRVQRRDSGRYFVRFRLNAVQTTVTFDTPTEAAQFAKDVEQRGSQWAWDNYQHEDELALEMTLSEWADRHFGSMPHVSPATLEEYRRDWSNRWEPHLGHLKLSRITRIDVTTALAAQSGSDKTIENAWGTLANMFKMAVIDGHLDKTPTLGVKLGRKTEHEKAEHRYLTAAEILQVVSDTSDRYKPLVWTLAGTGMRWGEATALTVGDFDLANRTVRVNKAWKRDRTKGWYVGPTKTGKSRRTVTLPSEVINAVAPLLVDQRRDALVFTNRNGDPVKHQPFYREHWAKACTANIAEPRPRIHDLRHSHVAILLAQGVGIAVIQARLGHEKVTTTIDTYGHLMPDLLVGAAEAMSHAFQAAALPFVQQPAALAPPPPPRLH